MRSLALAGPVAGLLLVLTCGAVALRESREQESHLRWVSHTQAVLREAAAVELQCRGAEAARLRFVVTGVEAEAGSRAAHLAAAREGVASLARLTSDNRAQQERVRELHAALERWMEAGGRQVAQRRGGAGAERLTGEVTRLFGGVSAPLEALRAEERGLLERREHARRESSRRALNSLMAGLVAAVVTGGLGGMFLLRERQERRRAALLLETVLDNLDAAVYVMDFEGRLLFLNRECARTLGGTPASIAGKSVAELFPEEQARMVVENNRRVREAQGVVELEEAVSSADGDTVYLSRKVCVQAGLYPFPVVCGVSTDITEMKRYEKELEDVNRELEAFTYSVSHDLRAPLRAVDGFARILVEELGPSLDAENARVLGLVRSNARRMGALIDDLLAFSRLGRQELRRAAVDMTALARGAAEEAAASEQGRAVRVSIPALPEVQGDPAMLAQVWRNLLFNAFKYTRGKPAAAVEVGARRDGAATEYWVRDDGAGFDPKYAHKLFGVFSRLHSAEEFEGTGVGLALVKRVVERHGGQVSAEGQPGRGATFRFKIPGGKA